MSACYWRPAPTPTLLGTRSRTGIIACGPCSSKPVLLFRMRESMIGRTQAWRKEQHRSALAKGTSWGDVEASMYLALAERYDYLATIEEAGGFKFYQKHHTHALAAMLAKKFPAHIPEEIFPRVVAFWAHAGFYVSKAAVETMRAVEAEFTSLGRVVCPQVRRLIDMYRERHPDREDDPRLQRLSDSLAALEVSVGLDPGVETNPIEADLSDSD